MADIATDTRAEAPVPIPSDVAPTWPPPSKIGIDAEARPSEPSNAEVGPPGERATTALSATRPTSPQRPPATGAGPTLPAPAAPSSDGSRRRIAIALGAVVVVAAAVFLAASAGNDSDQLSPDETIGTLLPTVTERPGPDIATENRATVAMLPTPADFEGAWFQLQLKAGKDAFQEGPNPSSAVCVLPPALLPEAGARVDLGSFSDGASVAAQIKVYPSVQEAGVDVATVPVAESARACLQRTVIKDLAKVRIDAGATIDVAQETVASPGLGEESYAYRFTETISAGGRTYVATVDLLTFRVGRTVGQLTVSAGLDRANDALVVRARDAFTSRFAAQ
jgi:hypothetical protein